MNQDREARHVQDDSRPDAQEPVPLSVRRSPRELLHAVVALLLGGKPPQMLGAGLRQPGASGGAERLASGSGRTRSRCRPGRTLKWSFSWLLIVDPSEPGPIRLKVNVPLTVVPFWLKLAPHREPARVARQARVVAAASQLNLPVCVNVAWTRPSSKMVSCSTRLRRGRDGVERAAFLATRDHVDERAPRVPSRGWWCSSAAERRPEPRVRVGLRRGGRRPSDRA